jgi:hypothetical protein
MMHSRWLGVLVLALVLPLPQVVARPDSSTDPLAVVPADSPIVLQVRGLDRTLHRFETMLTNALPEQGPKVKEQIEDQIKKGLQGRQIKGLVPDAPVFFVFTALPDPGEKEPPFAIIAHAADYKTFRDNLLKEDERKGLKTEGGHETTTMNGDQVYLVHSRDVIVLTPRKAVAEQFTRSGAGLKLDKELADRLLGADVGLYVDMAAVNKKFGDKIKSARDQLTGMFDRGKEDTAKSPLRDFLKRTIDAEFQVVFDTRALVSSFDFRPDGVAMEAWADFASDSRTSKFLKDCTRSSLEDLGKLPSGYLRYGAAPMTPEVLKRLRPWLDTLMGTSSSEKAYEHALNQLADAGPRWWTCAFDTPRRGLQVWHADRPKKLSKAQWEMFQAPPFLIKGKPELRRNAESYRGFNLNYAHIQWDFDRMQSAFTPPDASLTDTDRQQIREQMKRLMGEGLRVWFGTDGKVCISVLAEDWNQARQQIDRYLDGKDTVDQQAAFRDARSHLPPTAGGIYLVDAAHFAERNTPSSTPTDTSDRTAKPEKITKAPPIRPSFIGAAIDFHGYRGSFDLWVPGPAIHSFREMFQSARKWGSPR